ncbi:AAA family ATPase [Gracilibacillus oryzae]|uniref:AAA family ATPase n=1 Tax=Gracilibacillus oryzae TaxID=1672701 RepID=A0A7C8GWN7_9BACI|nr:AAA family ATPase [Gracilibacillus oryzae]KAB8139033.1 AAA family ATPase [Gracilibacillus oryzae]
MKIEHVHIYGFGKWQDQQFSFTSSTFQQIAGRNEAGKSTLRQFILYILFGQTTKKLDIFLPKHGTQLGGRITISGISPESLIMERIYNKNKGNATVYLPNGETKDEEWLKRKWKGIDRTHFEAIYSFDTIDLQKIQQLNNQALNDVLLAIGMTGSDRIYYAEKQLDKKRAELFKPYGKKPEINQLFDQLAYLKEKLSQSKKEEATYQNKLTEMATLEDKINNCTTELESVQEEYQLYEKKLAHHQLIKSYYLASQQLKRLKAPDDFPANGLTRYDNVKEKLLPIQSEASVLQRTKEERLEQIEQLQAMLLSEEQLERLQAAAQLSDQLAEHKQVISQLEDELYTFRIKMDSKLQQLGIPLTMEGMQELSLPFYLEELWSDLTKQKEQLEMEKQYVGEDIRSIERVLAEAEKDIEFEQQNLMDDAILQQYKLEVDKAEQDKEKQNQFRNFHQLSSQLKKWTKRSFVIFLAGIVVAVLLLLQNQLPWSLLFATVGVLPMIGLVIARKLAAEWFKPDRRTISDLSDKQLAERKGILQEQQIIREQLTQLTANKKQQMIEQLKLEERYHFVHLRLQQLNEKIADQMEQYPFLQRVNIVYWPRLFQQLYTLKEKMSEFQQKSVLLDTEKASLYEKQEALANLETDAEDYSVSIHADQERRNEIRQVQQQLDRIEKELSANTEKQKPYITEIKHLYAQANVVDEEAFVTNGTNFDERMKLKNQIEQMTDSLSVLFDERERKLFSAGEYEDEVTLRQKLSYLQQQINDHKRNIVENRQQLSDIRASIALLEDKEDSSILKHQYEQLIEQTNQLAREWAISQIAVEKLAKAKAKYYAEYIPKVFEYASDYFSHLTKAKYKRLSIPKENEWIKVIDANGIVYTLEELSQGTKDQLYISLRLALSKVVSAGIHFPFLIDDGFVHFDSVRKELIIQLLEEIGQHNQVIYFSTDTTLIHALQL